MDFPEIVERLPYDIRSGVLASVEGLNVIELLESTGPGSVSLRISEKLDAVRFYGLESRLHELDEVELFMKERQDAHGDMQAGSEEMVEIWKGYSSLWYELYQDFDQGDVSDWFTLRQLKSELDNPAVHKEIGGDAAVYLLDKLVTSAPNAFRDRTHIFKSLDELDRLNPFDRINPAILLRIPTGKAVILPRSLFIHSEGFESWFGRPDDNKKAGHNSKEVVVNYANLNMESAPPVEVITAYVMPDGRVFVSSGDAHRVAAALRRGDETIPVEGICWIVKINEQDSSAISLSNGKN